jgi:hypothetical protein
LTESVVTHKRKGVWHGEREDTSPTTRFSFSENEGKLILEAVTFRADSLVKEFEDHKQFWLNGELFSAHEQDPNSEEGKLWKFHTDRCMEIKNEVARLNGVERQLQLHFKIIDGSCPEALRTRERTMH